MQIGAKFTLTEDAARTAVRCFWKYREIDPVPRSRVVVIAAYCIALIYFGFKTGGSAWIFVMLNYLYFVTLVTIKILWYFRWLRQKERLARDQRGEASQLIVSEPGIEVKHSVGGWSGPWSQVERILENDHVLIIVGHRNTKFSILPRDQIGEEATAVIKRLAGPPKILPN